MHPRILSGRPLRPDWVCAAALARSLAFTPVVAACWEEERPSCGRSEGAAQVFQYTHSPDAKSTSWPDEHGAGSQAEISLLVLILLGYVCFRQLLIRIN